MPIPAFRKLNFKDQDLVTLQDNVGRTVDPVVSIPLLNGILLENVVLAGSGVANKVPHKLGRAFQGYLLVGVKTGALATYPLTATSGYDQTKYIQLSTPTVGSFTVDLWVF